MKTNDFINANLGKMVKIYGHGELGMSYKHLMYPSAPLLLIKLCKSGLAHVKDAFHNDYFIKPSAFRLWSDHTK